VKDADGKSIDNNWIVDAILTHRLVVRPSLLGRQWIVGQFKGVTGDGKVYCVLETVCEGISLWDAVYLSVTKIKELQEKNENMLLDDLSQ
jgi:hypothetical protein